MSFVKIYGTVLDSSLWGEQPVVVKVFLTMLAMADMNGIVRASLPGLARRAVVERADCEHALARLMAPDPDSQDKKRDPDADGRRIEEVPEGWRVINHGYYRDLRTDKQVADAERIKRLREQGLYDARGPLERLSSPPVAGDATNATRSNVAPEAEVEADAKADTEKDSTPPDVRVRQVLEVLGFQNSLSWAKLLLGMREGLGAPGMKPLPWDTLLEAAQELAVEVERTGGEVTPSRYKAFVGKVLNRQDRAAEGGPQYSTRSGPSSKKRTGYTLLASKLIQKVRALRNPQFPTNLLPDWRVQLDAEPIGSGQLGGFVYDFGISRFLAETKDDGTLTAQLAKAMEEAQL